MDLHKKTPILDQFEAQNILPDLCQIHVKSSQPSSSEFTFCLPAHLSSSQNQSLSTCSVCSLLPGWHHPASSPKLWSLAWPFSLKNSFFGLCCDGKFWFAFKCQSAVVTPSLSSLSQESPATPLCACFYSQTGLWGLSWDFLVSMVLVLPWCCTWPNQPLQTKSGLAFNLPAHSFRRVHWCSIAKTGGVSRDT